MRKPNRDHSRRMLRTSGIRLSQIVLGLGAIGCHAIPDPSASVCREMSDTRCQNILYNPDLEISGIEQTTWYNAPLMWQPTCPPLGGYPSRWRQLPPPSAVFTLPQPPATEMEPTKAGATP